MKTSVIDVRDMLSVLSVQGVEERIGEVPGVESVTVNHAAATATVRYDETRLHVGDIKSDVRQRGYAVANEPTPKPDVESERAGQGPPPQSPFPHFRRARGTQRRPSPTRTLRRQRRLPPHQRTPGLARRPSPPPLLLRHP
jgi:copper chaperone CopZ